MTARKEKIKGHCFICLKPGRHERACKINKVFCSSSTESLCINNFPEKPAETVYTMTGPVSTTITADNTLLASDEQLLMQTVTTEIEDLQNSRKQTKKIDLDTGSQRTYITENLAEKLQLNQGI